MNLLADMGFHSCSCGVPGKMRLYTRSDYFRMECNNCGTAMTVVRSERANVTSLVKLWNKAHAPDVPNTEKIDIRLEQPMSERTQDLCFLRFFRQYIEGSRTPAENPVAMAWQEYQAGE